MAVILLPSLATPVNTRRTSLPGRGLALPGGSNGYNLSRLTDVEGLLPHVRARGGAVLRFGGDWLAEVRR